MTDDEYCEMNHVIQRLSNELPDSVKAISYHDDDGNPFMLINAKYSAEEQRKSAKHELNHIRRGDSDNLSYIEYAI